MVGGMSGEPGRIGTSGTLMNSRVELRVLVVSCRARDE